MIRASGQSTVDHVRQIRAHDGVDQWLVTVLATVAPCSSSWLRGNRLTNRLEIAHFPRKCLLFHLYFLDHRPCLIHFRLQAWLAVEIQTWLKGHYSLDQAPDTMAPATGCAPAASPRSTTWVPLSNSPTVAVWPASQPGKQYEAHATRTRTSRLVPVSPGTQPIGAQYQCPLHLSLLYRDMPKRHGSLIPALPMPTHPVQRSPNACRCWRAIQCPRSVLRLRFPREFGATPTAKHRPPLNKHYPGTSTLQIPAP